MSESTHKAEVVPVHLEPHPNADSLSIVKVFGYVVCVRTEDWRGKDKGAYIVPDSVVPDDPYYQFLASGPIDSATGEKVLREKDRRIKAKKLRGVWSQGMLVPAPPASQVGDDVAAELGVTRYEPPSPDRVIRQGGLKGKGATEALPPALIAGVYDVESWYRYPNVIKENEWVVITEKIHGANFRAVWHDGQLHVGSHKMWKRSEYEIRRNGQALNIAKKAWNRWFAPILGGACELNEVRQNNDWWWTVARQYDLAAKLAEWPDHVFYGEVYGPQVQDLGYGVKSPFGLVFFDVRNGHSGEWFPAKLARTVVTQAGLDFVPELYAGAYHEAILRSLIDGNSVLSSVKQIREGVVIQTAHERLDRGCGRVKLKAVSNAYLERAVEKEIVA